MSSAVGRAVHKFCLARTPACAEMASFVESKILKSGTYEHSCLWNIFKNVLIFFFSAVSSSIVFVVPRSLAVSEKHSVVPFSLVAGLNLD